MSKTVFTSIVPSNALSSLMEGYLSGLGEVCHTLFGARGEAVMYEAVGDAFKKYLKKSHGIDFTRSDPWERYCEIVEFFTAQGFYSHVELDAVGGDRYWMLESGQYAGNIWEDQKAWERGTPPCPLWAVVVRSLSEIGYRVVLDEVKFRADMNGYESTFHFEKFDPGPEGILARAVREIRGSIFATDMLSAVADNTTDAVFLKDLEGRYLYANDAVSRFANRPLAEILGKDDTALLPPEAAASLMEFDREVIRSGDVRTFEESLAFAADGVTRTFLATKGVFRDAEGRPAGLFGISRDITERKRAEEELRGREKRHRAILRTAMDGYWMLDMEGRVLEVNETYCRMSGYDERELLGMRVSDVECNESPTDTAEHIRNVITDGQNRFETVHRRKDGSTFDVEISVKFHPVDGGRMVAFLRDTTGHKRAEAEKEKLRAQFLQAQKMEAVGQLAGGMAHDFNNILTVITGYCELLQQKIEKGSPMHWEVEEIRRAGDRASSLTRQLLAFSRKQVISPKILDLNVLIAETCKMLVRLIGENIELATIPGEDLGLVKVDADQFGQVMVNLAVNARDAMREGGRLLIETANVDLDDAYCARHPYVRPGRYVMLAVSDTGHGMSDEVKKRIFEPFFTTKPKGTGTGLGLAMIYGVVKQSDGSIEAESEAGAGTTFRIYLPRVESEDASPKESATSMESPGGFETVLLVEDEEIVRDLSAGALERLGYRAIRASNGDEAIALAEEKKTRIDLLVTDVVMPGMNGRELADRLVRTRPGIRVLFTSGYTDDAIVRHGVLEEGVHFIGKPYTPSALARKVREVLDKG